MCEPSFVSDSEMTKINHSIKIYSNRKSQLHHKISCNSPNEYVLLRD